MVRLVAADNRIVQCAAVRKDGWTKARREGFFAMLAGLQHRVGVFGR